MDNEKGDKLELNTAFVDAFTAFLEIPEKHKSVKGNIDKAEIMETLKAHGMAVLARDKGKDSAGIIQALKGGVFAPMEQDGAVKYIAASMAGSVCMTDIEKAIGTPIDNFQTFNGEETVCCISGLTYPQARLDLVYAKVAENKDVIKKNLAAARESGMKKDVNFLNEMEPTAKNCCQRLSENYRKHFIRVWKFIFDQNQPAGVAFAGQRNDPDPDNKDCIPIKGKEKGFRAGNIRSRHPRPSGCTGGGKRGCHG